MEPSTTPAQPRSSPARRSCVTGGPSASRPLDTRSSANNPYPADHHMTMLDDDDDEPGSLRFTMDYVGVDYHHASHSHIDALCHVSVGLALQRLQDRQYGQCGRGRGPLRGDAEGRTRRAWRSAGRAACSRSLVARTWRGVFRDDLEAAERSQGVTVGAGDILLVRTGYAQRLAELGDTNRNGSVAGAPDRDDVRRGSSCGGPRFRREQ